LRQQEVEEVEKAETKHNSNSWNPIRTHN